MISTVGAHTRKGAAVCPQIFHEYPSSGIYFPDAPVNCKTFVTKLVMKI
jgi:hypothetical protein